MTDLDKMIARTRLEYDPKVADMMERLRAALKPFAEMADQVDRWQRGNKPHVDFAFDAATLRQARTAYQQTTAAEKK